MGCASIACVQDISWAAVNLFIVARFVRNPITLSFTLKKRHQAMCVLQIQGNSPFPLLLTSCLRTSLQGSQVEAPDGSTMEARALLDSGSLASFISARMAQSLYLPRSNQSMRISGVAGLTRNSVQPITTFQHRLQPGDPIRSITSA